MSDKKYLTYQDARIIDEAEKVVTDPAVKSELARLGVAESKAVFKYDYSREFPVSKMYQIDDPESPHCGKHVVVVSQLPMVNVRGEKCLPGWGDNEDGTYFSLQNQFEATVDSKGKVSVTPLNDQPDGRKAGDTTTWKPVLKLDGFEVMPVVGPTILKTDPVNPNYSNNVLEWDYGICKRLLRLIEGRLLERWIFDENPGGTVRIEHNFEGPPLRLGQFAVDEDTEQVTVEQFGQVAYPFSISATGTFYPDANPESTTVDGYAGQNEGDFSTASWSDVRGAAGNQHNDSATTLIVDMLCGQNTDTWAAIRRIIALFDTSSLTSGATISAAVLSLRHNNNKTDTGTWTPAVHCVSSDPASGDDLVNGDYDSLGATSFGSVAWSAFASDAYNDWTLNASGIAAISKTGISKFGFRMAGDLNNVEPTWGQGHNAVVYFYAAEQGDGYKPKLVVTYTTGWQGKAGGVVNPEKVGGVGKADIKKIGGI